MSEQPMNMENQAESAAVRAIRYIDYRDKTRFGKGDKITKLEGHISSAIPIPKGRWKAVEVAAVTGYEKTYDRLNDNMAKRAMDGLRPFAYDVARVWRYAAGAGELVLGSLFATKSPLIEAIAPDGGPLRQTAIGIVGLGTTVIFRPVELVAQGIGAGAGFIGAEVAAPIANLILGGGKPIEAPPQPIMTGSSR